MEMTAFIIITVIIMIKLQGSQVDGCPVPLPAGLAPSPNGTFTSIRALSNNIDVCDVIYVRFGPYLYKYFCLLYGPAVMLLMCCYI